MKKTFMILSLASLALFSAEFQPTSYDEVLKTPSKVSFVYNADSKTCSSIEESFSAISIEKFQSPKDAFSYFQKVMSDENCSVEELKDVSLVKITCEELNSSFLFFESMEKCEEVTRIVTPQPELEENQDVYKSELQENNGQIIVE